MSIKGRVYIRTLGCPKNEADGASLIRYLEQAGWTVVDDPGSADAEVINTCGFIETTKLESIEAIWESVERKQGDAGVRKLIVTGCLAQRYPQQIASEITGLDAVVGFNRPDLVAKALSAPRQAGPPACWVDKPGTVYQDGGVPWSFDATHPAPLSAYIKVGDGCDNGCRFCAIPLIRGRLRSRPATSILGEIRLLVENGTKEVILVSQDTTSWGADWADGSELGTLLEQIDGIQGDFWIRVMYAHPAFLTDRHIAALGGCEKIVPYLDMPMQHISDRMLRIMNRHTTRAETQAKIDRLRSVRPDLALRTTFIVGHPGETRVDFAELQAFTEENEFERMGVFTYSSEDGTPAARYRGKVSAAVARERQALLTEAHDRWSSEQSVDKIGRTLPCLIEHRLDDGRWEGRSIHDAPEIDGRVLVGDDAIIAPGFHEVTITGAMGVDLEGHLPSKFTYESRRESVMMEPVS